MFLAGFFRQNHREWEDEKNQIGFDDLNYEQG